jgi:geranylgeranyl diphosphate synthase type II
MNLKIYQDRFEKDLPSWLEGLGEKSVLRDACEYALGGGGKRLRPAIVLMIAEALGTIDVTAAAMSVECFHTASLIADDLPCMDDDLMRRGRLSTHKVFGEATAILASYTLIAAGYGGIYQNSLSQDPKRAILCLKAATDAAGLQGATQGQFFDLFSQDPSLEVALDVIYKKTVTLFEIAFLFGWVFGGGDLAAIPDVKAAANHLGLAFQIADDLDDGEQDASHRGGVNIVKCLGKQKAISRFIKETALLKSTLQKLHLWTEPFSQLHGALAARGSFFSRCAFSTGSVGS